MNIEILKRKISFAKEHSKEFNFITLLDKSFEELKNMKLCISCSCGKDSVCVCILCWLLNIPIYSIVRYDNGNDWSCFDFIWEQLKELYSDRDTKFEILKGKDLFTQILTEQRNYKFGFNEYFGYCHCGPYNRFGTEQKQESLRKYSFLNGCTDIIGIASDENSRAKMFYNSYILVELDISEKEALDICYDYGFYWEQVTDFGFVVRLYDYCSRLSCIYCGFCNSTQIAFYIAFFPFSVFANMERIQKRIDIPYKQWGSIFNMPEKLLFQIKSIRDSVPISKIIKFKDSWEQIPY